MNERMRRFQEQRAATEAAKALREAEEQEVEEELAMALRDISAGGSTHDSVGPDGAGGSSHVIHDSVGPDIYSPSGPPGPPPPPP